MRTYVSFCVYTRACVLSKVLSSAHVCVRKKNMLTSVVRLLCAAATIQRWRTCCVRINGVCAVDTSWAVAWQKQLQCGFRPEAFNIARKRQSRSEWRARAFSWMITLHIAFSFKFNGLGPPSSRIWRIRPRKIKGDFSRPGSVRAPRKTYLLKLIVRYEIVRIWKLHEFSGIHGRAR